MHNIVYKHINEEFGWGQYGDFKVLIRKTDLTINATKLCADGGKRFDNWLRTDRAKELVAYITSSEMRKFSPALNEVTAYGEVRGTYVHRDLVPHIACWVSPEFALKVSYIVNQFFIRQYMDTIKEQTKVIEEKDTSIHRLETTVGSLQTDVKTLLTELQGSRDVIDTMSNQIKKMDRSLKVANENIIETLDTLGAVSNKQVPFERVEANLREQFVVTRIDPQKYRVIRTQARATNTAFRKIKTEYPHAHVVLKMDSRPNSKELWNAIKQQLKEAGCAVTVNDITLGPVATEETMLRIIQQCNNEKFDSFITARDKARRSDVPEEPREEEERSEEVRSEEVRSEEVRSEEAEEPREEPSTEEDEPSDAEAQPTAQELLLKTKPELLEMARQTGRKKFSKLNKVDLVNWLLN
jgi:septum formation inhibitor MinC